MRKTTANICDFSNGYSISEPPQSSGTRKNIYCVYVYVYIYCNTEIWVCGLIY